MYFSKRDFGWGSIWIAWGCNQAGIVFIVLIACAHFKSLSTPDTHGQIPAIWKSNIILFINEHKEVLFLIQYYLLYTWRQSGVLFKLGLCFLNFSFWLGLYYHFGRLGLYSRVGLYSSWYGRSSSTKLHVGTTDKKELVRTKERTLQWVDSSIFCITW